jgi:DNA-binding response OmpR family regulator
MRVLVVEDEQALAAGLRKGLEAEGFAVDLAFDGVDGLWLVRENEYDVVVLDIMLPGLDGLQVCAAMRAAEIWTPILVLTARESERVETIRFWWRGCEPCCDGERPSAPPSSPRATCASIPPSGAHGEARPR